MPTNKEMRERALDEARDAESLFRSGGGDAAHYIDVESLADWFFEFAASEVSRAVRECIGVYCQSCSDGLTPERAVSPPPHGWFHHESMSWCLSERIHELLYQRDLASKGEKS